MKKHIKFVNTFCADFETTVYEGQQDTRVWSAAIAKLFTDDVKVYKSIETFFDYLYSIKENSVIYFHNLKFDGSFILYYLLNDCKYEQALDGDIFVDDFSMRNDTIKYLISDMGIWYKILVKHKGIFYEFRDSYKILPFSLRDIGKSFETEHKKLEMEYTGFRCPNGYISPAEMEYIINDVLVLKEALEIMINEGHTKTTIGSCCISEFRAVCNRKINANKDDPYYNQYSEFTPYDEIKRSSTFPQYPDLPYLYDIRIPPKYGSENAGKYILKSYRGGWCYLVQGKENKIYNNGVTIDVNSLYPSVMSSESGKFYPYGEPEFIGRFDETIKKYLEDNQYYYFVRLKTRFYIKPDKLPFISIKNSPLYPRNKCLISSNIYKNGIPYDYYIDRNGDRQKAKVELTLTWNEYNLFLDHYFLYETEYLDCCYFKSAYGMFDQYIDKYRKIKTESKGAKRTLAKLFLNNLYGKMATSTSSNYKIAYIEDNKLKFRRVFSDEKRGGYIAIGSAITAYAREFTIRAAQTNFYGKDKRGFIYADTDSIHCDLTEGEIKGVKLHDTNFCCWKIESFWDRAIFVRAKTYIEHTKESDFYDVKCAGMPSQCKDLFVDSLRGSKRKEHKYSDEENEFVSLKRELTDFKVGLQVPSKLVPRQIEGGVLLTETAFTLKEGI